MYYGRDRQLGWVTAVIAIASLAIPRLFGGSKADKDRQQRRAAFVQDVQTNYLNLINEVADTPAGKQAIQLVQNAANDSSKDAAIGADAADYFYKNTLPALQAEYNKKMSEVATEAIKEDSGKNSKNKKTWLYVGGIAGGTILLASIIAMVRRK